MPLPTRKLPTPPAYYGYQYREGRWTLLGTGQAPDTLLTVLYSRGSHRASYYAVCPFLTEDAPRPAGLTPTTVFAALLFDNERRPLMADESDKPLMEALEGVHRVATEHRAKSPR